MVAPSAKNVHSAAFQIKSGLPNSQAVEPESLGSRKGEFGGDDVRFSVATLCIDTQ